MTSGGYVGLSIATLLSQHHKVMAVDIVPEKVELINSKKSPIQDEYIEKYLAEKELDLTATLDAKEAYSDADFVVIAAPTNYDSKKNFFDTSAVEAVIKLVIEYNPEAIMVIKSTIPVGFTASVREKYHCDNIIFSPEFLRESKALYDNLYPSRIIVGTDKWFEFGKDENGNDIPKTIISKEYSSEWRPGDEPYYPVNDTKNSLLYSEYKKLADAENKVVFGGRLGEYKYYDMDQVIAAVLERCERELK